MEKIVKFFSAPGTRHAIQSAAPTQVVANAGNSLKGEAVNITSENVITGTLKPKSRLLDRWLDNVVEFSGSQFVIFAIMIALIIWALLGIPFGHSNDWQVGISDAQAIINMVFDAFLMRQQLNAHESLMLVAASLRSRTITNKRMLRSLIESGQYVKVLPTQLLELEQTDLANKLPSENWLGRTSTAISEVVGHIASVCAFWGCIFIWIGFGHYCGWSDTWQLYINSATSAWMVFILAFLANIRERHNRYTMTCLEYIFKADAALELRLRTVIKDVLPNPPVVIPTPRRGRLHRVIDYYADLVGTLVGIAILFLVIIVWVAIGPAMSFNSNWWLLIGTYAGLVGMNDGFVLRNVQNILSGYQKDEFTRLGYEDMDMLSVIGVTQVSEERVADNSFSCRISVAMGSVCSHEITVVLGALTIIGLITGASAMRWSVTGQLLCNVPPSIIESFFMMILITGHNVEDDKRRIDLHNLYLRRLKLISHVNTVVRSESRVEVTTMPTSSDEGVVGIALT